ncbi:MAG: hypothetical protein IPJ08_21900 [Burkholderiales bacterium]|nr:hypothetical protein [Burkholderiales bacterium]
MNPSSEAKQINRGQRVGAAVHDYIERQVVIYKSSRYDPKALPDRMTDAQARASEDAFVDRFGFDAPEADRRAIVALKHRHQLTARSVRRLRLLGFLRVTESEAALRYSCFELWAGSALAAAACGMSVCLFALLVATAPAQVTAAAGVTALATLYAVAATSTYLVHVQPNLLVGRLLRRQHAVV